MADPRVIKLAETLVHYCTAVQPGDWVLILSAGDAPAIGERLLARLGAQEQDGGA